MMSGDQARRVLGVGARATQEQIRSAYRTALKSAHPDHGGSDERLRLVIEAFRLLDETAPRADDDAHQGRHDTGGDRIEITPVIAVVGGRISTRLADGRRVTVSLPRGLRQGDRIKVRDVVLTVSIKGRREMFVSGDDLCMMVRTTAQVLLEGGRVTVKLPSGPKALWVSKPTDSNHIVRIMGQGLPATSRHKEGHLILKLVPERGPKDSRLHARLRKFTGDWAGI